MLLFVTLALAGVPAFDGPDPDLRPASEETGTVLLDTSRTSARLRRIEQVSYEEAGFQVSGSADYSVCQGPCEAHYRRGWYRLYVLDGDDFAPPRRFRVNAGETLVLRPRYQRRSAVVAGGLLAVAGLGLSTYGINAMGNERVGLGLLTLGVGVGMAGGGGYLMAENYGGYDVVRR